MPMNWLANVRARLRVLFQKERLDHDMAEELRSHIEMQTRENIEGGMNPQTARETALREFGWVETIKEHCREQRGVGWIENLGQDIRYGARMLRNSPGFTVVTVLTLALGIGGTVSIFYWVDAMVFRPLPFPDADRLVLLSEVWTEKGWGRSEVSAGTFRDWQEQAKSFDAMATFEATPLRTRTGDAVETLRGLRVSTTFLQVLKVHPVAGRGFLQEEGQPGNDRVVILSEELWQRLFNGQSDVIGKPMGIDGVPHTIIGVMPKGFRFPYDTEAWLPLASSPGDLARRDHRSLQVVARLRSNVPLSGAQAELTGVTARIADSFPSTNRGWGGLVQSVRVLYIGGDTARTLSVLQGAAALVLLAACANVANLLLARFGKRQKEIAIRSSLGAGRGRIVRQMLTESLMLSALGTVAALLLAYWLSSAISAVIPSFTLDGIRPSFDSRVLFFALGLCLLAGLAFGTVPAWLLAKLSPNAVLKQSAGIRGSAAGYRRWLNCWIISEVTCAVTLLMGAGLMIFTLARLTRVDLGFDPGRVLMAEVNPNWDASEPDYSPKKVLYFERLKDELAHAAGIGDAAIFLDEGHADYLIEGQSDVMKMYAADCSDNLFRTLGVPLIQGRLFPEKWKKGDSIEVVANETFVRRFWPGQNPLGKRFKPDSPGAMWINVVGVVHDFRLERDQEIRPRFYTSYRWAYLQGVQLFLRAHETAAEAIGPVSLSIRRFDPDQTDSKVKTMNEVLGGALSLRYQILVLLSGFAGAALLLAIIGIYGVVSYSVVQQKREVGIRIALGALPMDVMARIVRQGMTPVLVGVGLGALGSLVLVRFLGNQLFGLGSLHPIIFAGSSVAMLLTAFLACFFPARRAAKLDPMEALRCE